MMNAAIEIASLTRTYPGGIKAVDGLSFSVQRGEIFGLLGVNGAGKTTTIKCLTTLLTPTSGSINVLGLDTRGNPVEIKKRIGVVPQENNLDTRLTVRQNLEFHCRYFGMKRSEYGGEVDKWTDLLGLKDKADEMVYHLSGGTKRKVMLAKAFLTNPELFILDEPTSGLDPRVRALIWERALEFKKSGKTVLLSTHHLEEAERLCDRIGIIHGGRLLSLESPKELKEKGFKEGMGIEEYFHATIGRME
jgi:ABC-type multidrug transport system ATPase subunit